jgi:outer membrane lipoprotein-sorting protein
MPTRLQLPRARLVFFLVVAGSVLVGQALTSQEQASQAAQKRDRVSFSVSQAQRRFLHTKTQVTRKCKQPITLRMHALSLADGATAYQTIMGCMSRAWLGRMQASKRVPSN